MWIKLFLITLAQACQEQTDIYHDLIGLDQQDPVLIDALKTKILIPPSKKPLSLTMALSRKNLDGQFGQVSKVDNILKAPKAGFYIEAGASGGEHLSNTLWFEIHRKWTGLLVEPNPDFVQTLKQRNRNAWILPHCLSTTTKSVLVDFDAHNFNGGIINTGQENRVKPGDIGRPKGKPVPPQIKRRTITVSKHYFYVKN